MLIKFNSFYYDIKLFGKKDVRIYIIIYKIGI